jgi:hypothetical protein
MDDAYLLPNFRFEKTSLLLKNRFNFANILSEALIGKIIYI